MSDQPHRRFNPLKGEWLIVSPQRAKRPWMGQKETTSDDVVPRFDPRNPLCPGVERQPGKVNPQYERTFVFENDFPALLPATDDTKFTDSEDPLFKTAPANGLCRVVCFHQR